MKWHLCPKWIELRGYKEGDYETADSHTVGINLMINEVQAIASMATKRDAAIGPRDLTQIAELLRGIGIKRITMWRHHKHWMPWGRVIRREGALREWEIKLDDVPKR